MKNFVIRRETPADYRAAEQLTREAFWNVYRPGCLEHYVLHQFRDRPEFVPELDLVMEADGEIVGHVMYVRAVIGADGGAKMFSGATVLGDGRVALILDVATMMQ